MKSIINRLVVVVAICGVAGVSHAGRTTVDLRSSDVTVVRDAQQDRYGDYFLVAVDVPEGLTSGTLLGAILEFYLDVDCRSDTVWVERPDTSYAVVHWTPMPLIEVFALNSSSGSALDSERWDRSMAFPVPIGLGEDKVARVDITRLVKYYLENPNDNHGLVVGSLSGRRGGLFALAETLAGGVFARIRYVY